MANRSHYVIIPSVCAAIFRCRDSTIVVSWQQWLTKSEMTVIVLVTIVLFPRKKTVLPFLVNDPLAMYL